MVNCNNYFNTFHRDADFDIFLDINEHSFRNILLPIFMERKYQIDRIARNHYNLKPVQWGIKVKGLGNDVLISLFLKPWNTRKMHGPPPAVQSSEQIYPRITSRIRMGDKLMHVPFNPFEYAYNTYGNTFFEHRFHSGIKQGRFHCEKFWHDIWYDYGGRGTSNPPPKVSQDHNACLPDYRADGGGTFFPWQQ